MLRTYPNLTFSIFFILLMNFAAEYRFGRALSSLIYAREVLETSKTFKILKNSF